MTSIQGDSTSSRRSPLHFAVLRLIPAAGCGLLGFLSVAGAQTKPTTSTLTLTASDPYTMTCTVNGVAVSGVAGPAGTVTFSDTTTSTTLGTMNLGAAAQAQAFAPEVPPNAAPGRAIVGDFNGDGIPDIAAATDTGIQVFLGNGDGTFQSPVNTSVNTAYAYFLAIGDFNGDGKLDLAAAGGPEIEVFLGNGDGSFQTAPQVFDVTGGGYIATGDFNGDGVIDIAVTEPNSHMVAIVLGNTSGTLTGPTTFAAGTYPQYIVVADFNGDHRQDIAVTNNPGVSVLLSNADGSFQTPIRDAAVDFEPDGMVTADFNGDGKPDIVITGGGAASGAWVLNGNGDGTFQVESSPTISGFPGVESNFVTGDFNGDGIPDLLTTDSSGSFELYPGKGKAIFGTPVTFANTGTDEGSFLIAANFTAAGATDLLFYPTVFLNILQASAAGVLPNAAVDAGTISTHDLDCSYAGDSTYASSVSPAVVEKYGAAAIPVFSLQVGNYASAQTVTISDSTPIRNIYYTNDGSTPTLSSPQYTGPIAVTSTVTLKAIAGGYYHTPSAVSEATYTITDPPAFSVPGGTYSTQQTVALSDSTANASIYYTTDGSVPGKTSTVYTVPILVAGKETINAVALTSGNLFSAVSSATYNDPLTTTTTALTASAKSASVDQPIALTATVTGTNPTGSVTFAAGSQTLGTATLASGVATLSTSFAAAGTFAVKAVYSGDASNAASTSSAVTLTATKVTPVITWNTPAPITYGTAVGATQEDATANVAGTFTYYPAAGWKPIVGTHTITATFTPTNTAEYKVTTATVTLTVNKATPVLAWATPAPIAYGTAVGPTQQDAKANVAGTFSYYPAAGWKPIVGTHTMTATFTPTDTTDYVSGKQVTVTLTVNSAP